MRTLLGLSLLLAACGGPPPSSCDYRPKGSGSNYCQDYAGLAELVAPYASDCTQRGGSWTDRVACPAAGKLGGCKTDIGDGTTVTNWFYAGPGVTMTAADVMQGCGTDSTYVAP